MVENIVETLRVEDYFLELGLVVLVVGVVRVELLKNLLHDDDQGVFGAFLKVHEDFGVGFEDLDYVLLNLFLLSDNVLQLGTGKSEAREVENVLAFILQLSQPAHVVYFVFLFYKQPNYVLKDKIAQRLLNHTFHQVF
jgi:hypothetical protein